jgi:predicted double-glycine peptidase
MLRPRASAEADVKHVTGRPDESVPGFARRSAVLALLLVFACGRALPESELFVHDDAVVVASASLIAVPLVRQKTAYSCGDAVILALLRYYAPRRFAAVSETALYAPLETTTEEGTEPAAMTSYFSRASGLSAETRFSSRSAPVSLDDLERAVDRGAPPIVAFQAWQSVRNAHELKSWKTDWDDGHYAIVVAYDAKNLYFMDPSTDARYAYVPISEFIERWHDVLGKEKTHAEHITIFPAPPPSTPTPTRLDRQGVRRIY